MLELINGPFRNIKAGRGIIRSAPVRYNLRLTYRPTLSSRTEYALFQTAGLMRLVDPSTSDGKAFLEFGGKIQMTQMTPDTAAAD